MNRMRRTDRLLTILVASGCLAFDTGCSSTANNSALDRQVATLISDHPDWPPQAFYELFELREGGISERQIVTIESSHNGPWQIRDRQLLQDGLAVVADYTIWVNAEDLRPTLVREHVVEDGGDHLDLIHAAIETYARHSDLADRSHGNSFKIHVVNTAAFFGEDWLYPYHVDRVLEPTADAPAERRVLPANVLLEMTIRLLDQHLFTKHLRPQHDPPPFDQSP